jgi:hypothetical protein
MTTKIMPGAPYLPSANGPDACSAGNQTLLRENLAAVQSAGEAA